MSDQVNTLQVLTDIVSKQISMSTNLLSIGNKNLDCMVKLQQSMVDSIITLNCLTTAKLTEIYSESGSLQEQDFMMHSMTVNELDDEYDLDSGIDG